MWSWIYFNAFVFLQFSVFFLNIKISLALIPNLDSFNLLVFLCDSVNIPINHIIATVLRVLCPHFHNAQRIRTLKADFVFNCLICVHIFKAFGYCSRQDFIQFGREIFVFVEILVQLILKFWNIAFHESIFSTQHILNFLVN